MITYRYPVPPALASEMHAAVRDYAARMGVSEDEAWRALNEHVQEEANRELRRYLDAEVRRLIDGGE